MESCTVQNLVMQALIAALFCRTRVNRGSTVQGEVQWIEYRSLLDYEEFEI